MKKLQSTKDKFIPVAFAGVLLLIWELVVELGLVEKYILPSPTDILGSLFSNFGLIMNHSRITFFEGVSGLLISIAVSFLFAILMDQVSVIKKALYPILVISQTVPIIVIAPLIAMWFGFGITPKIFVVVLVCFFPITINLSEGLSSVDLELIDLLRSMGATKMEIFKKVKLPSTLPQFFSGLKIGATYSIMGAVIGEWLGGKAGLGVFMIRARQSFELEKVFASILIIVLLSVLIFYLIDILQKRMMPWAYLEGEEK